MQHYQNLTVHMRHALTLTIIIYDSDNSFIVSNENTWYHWVPQSQCKLLYRL
jgi:hypothetical protein